MLRPEISQLCSASARVGRVYARIRERSSWQLQSLKSFVRCAAWSTTNWSRSAHSKTSASSCSSPEYWVVNLVEHCIEVYTEPVPGAYSHLEKYARGQAIRLVAFPDVSFAVSDVLK